DAPGTQARKGESRGEGSRAPAARGAAGEGRTGDGRVGGGSQGSAKGRAFQLFEEGRPVAEVAATVERALSTTWDYLAEFCQVEQLLEPGPWVSDADFLRVRAAAEQVGFGKLVPIHAALGGQLDYSTIKIAIICWRNAGLGQDADNTGSGRDRAAGDDPDNGPAVRATATSPPATPDE
ncbi:MAG: helix-turn-helix domain-containing protein, partial [Planctomycetaceae bacterium]